MNKKIFWASILMITLLLTAILLPGIYANAVSAATTVSGSQLSGGMGDDISIRYAVDRGKGVLDILVSGTNDEIMYRLMKDDITYTYRHKPDARAAIPLNMGSGEYALTVGVMISDTRARVLWRTTLPVALDCELIPYLSSSKIVNWTEEMPLVQTAKKLAHENDPRGTALAIGRYISERFAYDYDIMDLPAGYIPDLIQVYENDKGICYDYAALYAAMCRAVGIPTKLIMGYSSYIGPEYHAWCLVRIDGEWHKFDPVYSMYKGAQFLCASNTVEERKY